VKKVQKKKKKKKRKGKEKERNIDNDLAVLPSHDKEGREL